MANTDGEQPFEEIFGPLARYSDYKVGDTITYHSPDGPIRRGEIMWIEPAGCTAEGKEHPLTYWVGFDAFYPGDILEDDDEGDEPLLVHCPYCRTTPSPEAIQCCRQRYGK